MFASVYAVHNIICVGLGGEISPYLCQKRGPCSLYILYFSFLHNFFSCWGSNFWWSQLKAQGTLALLIRKRMIWRLASKDTVCLVSRGSKCFSCDVLVEFVGKLAVRLRNKKCHIQHLKLVLILLSRAWLMYWPADIGLPVWYVYWNFSFSERNVETNPFANLKVICHHLVFCFFKYLFIWFFWIHKNNNKNKQTKNPKQKNNNLKSSLRHIKLIPYGR